MRRRCPSPGRWEIIKEKKKTGKETGRGQGRGVGEATPTGPDVGRQKAANFGLILAEDVWGLSLFICNVHVSPLTDVDGEERKNKK